MAGIAARAVKTRSTAARAQRRLRSARTRWLLAASVVAAGAAQAELPMTLAFGPVGATPAAPWRFAGLPHQSKPATAFSVVELDGRRALRIEADRAYGNLVHPVPQRSGGLHLAWQWRVDQPLAHTDLRQRSGDDAAAKVCVLYDLPMASIPFVERQLLRLARSRSDEPLPAATVCYVWDTQLAVGTALANPYTQRVRYLVLHASAAPAEGWSSERRELAADFFRLFGDEATALPPITAIAVGADADNTQGHSVAHVANLVLEP